MPSASDANTARALAARLGPNPVWPALAFWAAGVLFCLAAWQIHKIDHVFGSILLGLSTFVNFFCFMQGLNRMRRAWTRWRTLSKTRKLGLSPERVYCGAGFIVVDPAHGFLVCNGQAADVRAITRIVCKSTWMAHKLELYGCGRLPLVLGFPDRDTLFAASARLREVAQRLTGAVPEYALLDELAPKTETVQPPVS